MPVGAFGTLIRPGGSLAGLLLCRLCASTSSSGPTVTSISPSLSLKLRALNACTFRRGGPTKMSELSSSSASVSLKNPPSRSMSFRFEIESVFRKTKFPAASIASFAGSTIGDDAGTTTSLLSLKLES